MTTPIKVFVLDADRAWWTKLHHLLHLNPQFEIVASVDNQEDGLRLAEQFQPDIILMGLNLPNTDVAALFQTFRRTAYRAAMIFMLEETPDQTLLIHLFKLGAENYLDKHQAEVKLSSLILDVSARNIHPYLKPLVSHYFPLAVPVQLSISHRIWSGWGKGDLPPPETTTVTITHAGQSLVLMGLPYKYLLQVVGMDTSGLTLIVNGLGLKQGAALAKPTINLFACREPHQFTMQLAEKVELYTCTMDAGDQWELTFTGR